MPKLMCCRRTLKCGLVLMVILMATAVVVQAQTEAAVPEASVQMTFGIDLDRATRTLIEPGTEFAAEGFSAEAGQVYCLTRLTNMAAPTTVTHVWYHEGKTMARVELKVGGTNWRTWSSKRILPTWTGQWEVKVLDADGVVLASSGFTIQ